MNVKVFLKNGQIVKFKASSITRQTSNFSNEFAGLKWINMSRHRWQRRKPELLYIRIEEVDAIVTR
jgi:hypothetical protein